MVTKLLPKTNKVYFINQYTLFHILEGTGGIQVDFRAYHDWKGKIIFLEKGQYIKFLGSDFVVRKIEFSDKIFFRNKDVRVLFKHLVQLGYINFDECIDCQKYLNNTVFSNETSEIIDISSKQWYWQNPFHANKDEYHLIFDVKEVIDKKYKNQLSNEKLTQLINHRGYDAHAIFKSKIGLSIKSLFQRKRLLESKKEIVFTDKSIKEIAYDLGYKDPAYFNRLFKKEAGKSPIQFREAFDYEDRDLFIQDLYELLKTHHKEKHSVDFYAARMHLSIKTLSRKVREKLNISIGQLIRLEIINTAKVLLEQDININEIAYQLGFEEANHFSTFFKHHTKLTPSQYKART
jgi:AraC-like DNA-binding protein